MNPTFDTVQTSTQPGHCAGLFLGDYTMHALTLTTLYHRALGAAAVHDVIHEAIPAISNSRGVALRDFAFAAEFVLAGAVPEEIAFPNGYMQDARTLNII